MTVVGRSIPLIDSTSKKVVVTWYCYASSSIYLKHFAILCESILTCLVFFIQNDVAYQWKMPLGHCDGKLNGVPLHNLLILYNGPIHRACFP